MIDRRLKNASLVIICAVAVASCKTMDMPKLAPTPEVSEGHLSQADSPQALSSAAIPKPVAVAAALPIPKPSKPEQLHTVIVSQVPVNELLFSLSRDAKLNLDIDEDVTGNITLNAIDQPLIALLERIVESADLVYEIKNDVLRIKKDSPYLHNYQVDYINMSRTSTSIAQVSTQIASTGQGAGGENSGSEVGNNSLTDVSNLSEHDFWNTLEKNITAIVSDGSLAQDQASNPNIILNKESGILGVKATQKQHREINAFINEVLFSTRRQVLIEATIAEVTLNDRYQAGIDWNFIGNNIGDGFNIAQTLTDISIFDRPTFEIQYNDQQSDGDSIQTTLRALKTFGDVSIMSSPKVMALNNQTALLKVVDNLVYFTVDVDVEINDDADFGVATYETEIQTVPVGFVMSVTPYISGEDNVTLNVRPTISRVIGQARDPNPQLAQLGIVNEIPVIQVREVESVLKVRNGDIAVMGGLMQDESTATSSGVPVLSSLPGLGKLFKYEDNAIKKTELVIFIRPIVVQHASVDGDQNHLKRFLRKPSPLKE